MAIIKHIASKNANYAAAPLYLCFQHDEQTQRPLLDEGTDGDDPRLAPGVIQHP